MIRQEKDTGNGRREAEDRKYKSKEKREDEAYIASL